MDTIEKYIKMCLFSDKKLRSEYSFKEGDWIFSLAVGDVKVLSSKVMIIRNDSPYLKIAVPKRMTLMTPILESDPLPSLERYVDEIDFELYPERYWIRLHRQDQLQQMITAKDYCGYETPSKLSLDNLISGFSRFCDSLPRSGKAEGFPYSMEEIWLRWVMKLKFGKLWTGTEWYPRDNLNGGHNGN